MSASNGGDVPSTPSVPQYPVCPRCDKPVRMDRHELRLQLVNADPQAPKESTDLHAVFHHRCAADVWTMASNAWVGNV